MTRDIVSQTSLDDAEEEDEETLQLQLAALEAKIKLKKIQQKKAKCTTAILDSESKGPEDFGASGKENKRPTVQEIETQNRQPSVHLQTSRAVQIPVSPQRKQTVAQDAKSPGRIQLGIDKGLRGRNISLRRPAQASTKDDDPFPIDPPARSISKASTVASHSQDPRSGQPSGSRSFSKKIAETRKQDKAHKERVDKLRRQRSAGFSINQQDIDSFQSAAKSIHAGSDSQRKGENQSIVGKFSRDQVIRASNQANAHGPQRSNTSTGIGRSKSKNSTDIWTNHNAPPDISGTPKVESNASKRRLRSLSPETTGKQSPQGPDEDLFESLFEPFSSIHLSKRLLPHDVLTRTLTHKHLFRLPDLLSTVKSPDYVLPDIPESDYVVLAVIASKSSPLNHKGAHKTTNGETTSTNEATESEQNVNGKYMAFTLTDMKWTVDLFLFSTGYTRFRKLIPGTVVALLNPDVMPPSPGKADTGRFSLKLSSSDDTVLEIGKSRDLSWCKSVRKDGKQCETWVDKRHTEFCEFHVDVVIERTRRGRMETQGMSAPFAPGGKKGGRTGYFGEGRRGQKGIKDDGLVKKGPQYDRGSGTRYFVAPSVPGQTTAQLLDAEGATDRHGSKEDRIRKRLAEREKEQEIARKLGEGGNGAGSEYLRLRQGLGPTMSNAEPEAADPVDATSLGLLGNRARNVHLSPMKRKRVASGSDLIGSRKKTRFLIAAGIKEAGRDSFGGDRAVELREGEDDDDELEVV